MKNNNDIPKNYAKNIFVGILKNVFPFHLVKHNDIKRVIKDYLVIIATNKH